MWPTATALTTFLAQGQVTACRYRSRLDLVLCAVETLGYVVNITAEVLMWHPLKVPLYHMIKEHLGEVSALSAPRNYSMCGRMTHQMVVIAPQHARGPCA